MDIQILSNDRISDSGSMFIKSMQNASMNLLDVLVRESIQNSLDAEDSGLDSQFVSVDFVTGKFDAGSFSDELSVISDTLKSKYPQKEYDFIAIRDSGTTGLTGLDEFDDDRSKLQSLVYHIGKGQSKEGAGGSWGLGKTTFFRIGIGIVVYYSRTFEHGKYRNLLAASLVEDETADPMITVKNSRGIAFFGRADPESSNPDPLRKLSLPITDESEISRILGYFGLDLYSGNSTGTTIIMPYVNNEKLLRDMFPNDLPFDKFPSWAQSIEDCLNLLIQRWYAPRIRNYKNFQYNNIRFLNASVNKNPITTDRMKPFFRLIQELFDYSDNSDEIVSVVPQECVISQPVKYKVVEGGVVGNVAVAYFDKKYLGLSDKQYFDVYSLIGHYHASNTSIVTYTRKPGMLINYEVNSIWNPKMQLDEDKILVAVFKLKNAYLTKKNVYLEEYVRSYETSSHSSWIDEKKDSILDNIAEKTSKVIRSMFVDPKEGQFEKRSKLSDIFAQMFMPPVISTESKPTEGTEKIQGSVASTPKARKSHFEISSNDLIDSKRIMVFDISNYNKDSDDSFRFVLSSETGSVEAPRWESNTLNEFPLNIESMEVIGMSSSVGDLIECSIPISLNEDTNRDPFVFRPLITGKFNVCYGFELLLLSKHTLRIKISAVCNHPSFSFELKHSQGAE